MECCGEDRMTPYCPMCGKLITDTVLATLIAHISTQARNARNYYSKCAGDTDPSEYLQSRLPKLKARAEKWEAWHKTILNLAKLDKEDSDD